MRHLIDPLDFSPEEIDSLLNLADRIRSDPAAYQDVAAHKKLATLFYEPSTRTRLSFEAAMLNLGGHVLGFPSENVSSASKGESVADTIRVISCYADIVAMRLAPGEAMLLLDEVCFNRLCRPVMRSLSYYTNFFDFSILRKLL